jgi:Flp pilus assembly protein TadG
MTDNRHEGRAQRGQAMVEFVLVLPILLALLIGMAQAGVVYNNWVTLTDAVRAGARKAAVSRTSATRNDDVKTAVKNSAANLDQSKLVVDTPTSTWNPGDNVTVCAHYPYSLNMILITVKTGNLNSCTTERVE